MTTEEETLYNQLKQFRTSHDKLYVIFEELDELVRSGYNGSFKSEHTEGLLSSLSEYKRWKNAKSNN